uniref:Nuclear anchorage protein 1 spectrin-like repeat domain-containing protein n=1 Tax=Parascaris univalens TaxID=6257 RepID=A0A915A4T8_PARUN
MRVHLQMKSLTTENERWRSISDQMEKREFEIDERISKFKEMMAKRIRRQEKLVKKLASFHEWLNLVDEDFASIQGWPQENKTAIKEALLSIRKVCLKQQKFVEKLKNTKLPPPHSAEAEICYERFQVTLEKISSCDIEESGNIPSSVTYLLPSTSMQSQPSPYSSSSSGSEEEAEEELLNEMKGVREEIVGYTNDLVQRMSTAEGLMEIRQLFPEIDGELNDIAESLSVLNADYVRSLKPLSQAQDDLKALKGFQARRKLLEAECEKFSSKLDGDELAILRSFIHQSRSLEGPIQDFLDELRKEVDDEIALRRNYENIMMELNRLNDDVSHRAKSVVSEMRQQVENVEAELALLRAQCSQCRNYVENSIEESSPTASPGGSRRKRIILMVSRTVTTIIQVVEDELRRSPGSKEKDLLDFRQKLEEMNSSIEEGHDEKDIEVLITSARNLDEKLKSLLSCDFSKQEKDELEASLAIANEGHVELEHILRTLQREHPPSIEVSAYVENIITLITSLQALEIEISEQIQARSQGDVVIGEAVASETNEREENAVKVVAELRGLLEEEESILGDKYPAVDIIEQTIEKAERVLSESRRLQSIMPTHTLYEDLRVLIAELESINGKLIARRSACLTFKNECRFVSDLVGKVREDITDIGRRSRSTDELIETIRRLQHDEEELAKVDGSSMIRIQQLCEMLKPMEFACAETRLLQADVDQAKQLLSEAINDRIREKETVEKMQKEIAELDDMLQKGEKVLLTEEELKRSDDSTLLA